MGEPLTNYLKDESTKVVVGRGDFQYANAVGSGRQGRGVGELQRRLGIVTLTNDFPKLLEDVRAVLSKNFDVTGQLLVNSLPGAIYRLILLVLRGVAFAGDVLTIRVGQEGAIASHRRPIVLARHS
jgi:hypothetical protein